MLQIVFTMIDDQDWDRPFRFDIEFATRTYTVPQCEPSLPTLILDDLLAWLNRTRDFFGFLKKMRKAFKDNLDTYRQA